MFKTNRSQEEEDRSEATSLLRKVGKAKAALCICFRKKRQIRINCQSESMEGVIKKLTSEL